MLVCYDCMPQEQEEVTHRLSQTLGQVGQVKVGGALVSLCLETGVEALTSKANLIAKVVEATDAPLRVTNVGELGKTEARGLVST